MNQETIDPKLCGLSEAEARHRLITHGPNALPEAKSISHWQRLLSQFNSPLIYILLFALALDLALWLHEGAREIPFEAVAIDLILIAAIIASVLLTWAIAEYFGQRGPGAA